MTSTPHTPHGLHHPHSARAQVTRLLAMVPYLQNRGGVPLRELAAEFGVSTEQVRKDLNVLWFCGLPGLGPGDLIDLNFEPLDADEDGVVTVSNADYLRRPLRLGATEAAALTVALNTLRESSSEASREVIDRVLGKLERATTGPSSAAIGTGPTSDSPRVRAIRDLLREAIGRDRQVRLDYYVPARDERTERVVDPIGFVESDGVAYLDAWCHRAGGRRTFRLDRIDEATALDSARRRASQPPLDLGTGLFTPGPEATRVRLRLRPSARWLVDYYPVSSVEEDDDGGLQVELRVAEPGWLHQLVLRLAPEVTVVSPAAWADVIVARARATLALYHC